MLAGGVSGFFAAIMMAAPAFLSIDSRGTLIKLTQLKLAVDNQALLAEQEKTLLQKALKELAQEKRYLQRGLTLLAISFALTIAGTLVDGDRPAVAVESNAH
ncbi:hypothetical protein BPNPMPFG_004736 [Mesorhizobium sp. AR07]|uniref:hypothetical protein n=1 Tax=Mesorhizobium sp. AR07 TaxID=2865838 RepID=UPI00215EDC8B|nr:hypothetical protein [Mesorhizobium sp. AR07]UVK42996.1 hypothetical protein BPNPMPFG_004736 [Mesorhizobium sp. AR07]